MGRLWKTACLVLKGSRISTARFPTGCGGLWKTLVSVGEFWEYEMPEQANTRQITTAGFPQPSFRCEGIRRLLFVIFFCCQSSSGIGRALPSSTNNGGEYRANRQPYLKQWKRLSSLFFSPGVPVCHFFEWPSLAENRWPNTGRKLTTAIGHSAW